MYLITNDARVEQTKNGLFFYEKDIAFLPYLFLNDLTIETNLTYRYPGIGFCIVKNTEKPLFENNTSYLFNFDENKITTYKKVYSVQTKERENSCLLETSDKEFLLRFIKKGKTICIEADKIDNSGEIYTVQLEEILLEENIDSFYFGISSSANNTVSNISVKESCPQFWFSNIDNAEGGRISFAENRIIIENCLHDVEVEQTNIELDAGVYHLKYEREDVGNEPNNLEVFLFEAQDEIMYDRDKNLLDTENKFYLEEAKKIVVRIRGNSGIIKNLYITEKAENPYIPTYEVPRKIDGSMISFDLKEIAKIEMDFEVEDIPFYELTEEAKYFIIEQKPRKILLEDLFLELNKQYRIIFESASNEIFIYDFENNIVTAKILDVENILKMFYNVTATIHSLTVWDYEENKIDISIQRTFKKYVPGYLTTPILVIDDNGVPFDISSSYREVIIEETQIDIVRSDAWKMELSKTLMPDKPVTVYGLSNHALIRANQKTIQDTCSVHAKIDNSEYAVDYEHNKIIMSETKKKEFDNFAVVYAHMDNILYWFTNWERVVTEGNSTTIPLKHTPNETSGSIIVYGMKTDSAFKKENLYKVFNYRSENSIDCAADNYDQLSELAFALKENEIEIEKDVADDYEFFILDYLKNDSYAINYLQETDQYEIDISTGQNKATMLYDMSEDGSISSYRSVDIVPTSSKYIVLRG